MENTNFKLEENKNTDQKERNKILNTNRKQLFSSCISKDRMIINHLNNKTKIRKDITKKIIENNRYKNQSNLEMKKIYENSENIENEKNGLQEEEDISKSSFIGHEGFFPDINHIFLKNCQEKTKFSKEKIKEIRNKFDNIQSKSSTKNHSKREIFNPKFIAEKKKHKILKIKTHELEINLSLLVSILEKNEIAKEEHFQETLFYTNFSKFLDTKDVNYDQNNIDLDIICYNNSNLKKSKLFNADNEFIINLLNSNKHLSIAQINQIYNENHEEKIGKEYTRRIIKRSHRYVEQKIDNDFLFTEEFLDQTYMYIEKFNNLTDKNIHIIYTDECKFKPNTKIRKWVEQSTALNFKEKRIQKKAFTYSLILSTLKDKVVYYRLVEKKTKSSTIIEYFTDLIEYLRSIGQDIKRTYFYLDNVGVHKSYELQNFLIKTKINIIYGVRYFSPLDFCEYIFNIIKQKYYKKVFFNKKEFVQFLNETIQLTNSDTIKLNNYYKNMIKIMCEVLIKIKFYTEKMKHR